MTWARRSREDVRAAAPRSRRGVRRALKWSLTVVLLSAWTALSFGAGVEAHQKQMALRQYTPGYLSYSIGSAAYTFGWSDGFSRGFDVGFDASAIWARAGRRGPPDATWRSLQRELAPDYASAMAARLSGLRIQPKGKSLLDLLPGPGETSARRSDSRR